MFAACTDDFAAVGRNDLFEEERGHKPRNGSAFLFILIKREWLAPVL